MFLLWIPISWHYRCTGVEIILHGSVQSEVRLWSVFTLLESSRDWNKVYNFGSIDVAHRKELESQRITYLSARRWCMKFLSKRLVIVFKITFGLDSASQRNRYECRMLLYIVTIINSPSLLFSLLKALVSSAFENTVENLEKSYKITYLVSV